MNITNIIRNRYYLKAGIIERPKDQTAIKRDIRTKIDVLDKVYKMAANRLTMGTLRYGVSHHKQYDYRGKLDEKLALYDKTGNKEFLVDAVNYCVLEFEWTNRKGTFFQAEDRNESWE